MGKKGMEKDEIILRKGRAESRDEANGAEPLWCAWVAGGRAREARGRAQGRRKRE